MRQWQSENKDRAIAAVLAGRGAKDHCEHALLAGRKWGRKPWGTGHLHPLKERSRVACSSEGPGFSSTSENSPRGSWSGQGTWETEWIVILAQLQSNAEVGFV